LTSEEQKGDMILLGLLAVYISTGETQQSSMDIEENKNKINMHSRLQGK